MSENRLYDDYQWEAYNAGYLDATQFKRVIDHDDSMRFCLLHSRVRFGSKEREKQIAAYDAGMASGITMLCILGE